MLNPSTSYCKEAGEQLPIYSFYGGSRQRPRTIAYFFSIDFDRCFEQYYFVSISWRTKQARTYLLWSSFLTWALTAVPASCSLPIDRR